MRRESYSENKDNYIETDNARESETTMVTIEPENEWPKQGTVYMSYDCEFSTIKVRTEPKLLKDDSNVYSKRVRRGDKVTVYEMVEADGYTWYKIDEKKWFAGNGTSYYVIFDGD